MELKKFMLAMLCHPDNWNRSYKIVIIIDISCTIEWLEEGSAVCWVNVNPTIYYLGLQKSCMIASFRSQYPTLLTSFVFVFRVSDVASLIPHCWGLGL